MFKISVVSVPTRIVSDDLDRNIAYFLSDIGYIPRLRPDTDFQTISKAAYFRLFKECFVINSSRYWSAEELMAYLQVSRTTLYMHLNKLKGLDILEEIQEGKTKKYRIRFGDLLRAWNWVEVNLKMAIENYRHTVEIISEIVSEKK